jgi:serine/threonine protein kinase
MEFLWTARCKSNSEVVWNCVWCAGGDSGLEEHLFYVLEYVSGGSLFDQLRQAWVFDEQRIQFYAAEKNIGS